MTVTIMMHQHILVSLHSYMVLNILEKNSRSIIMYFYMSQSMIKPTKWHVRPTKTQIMLGVWLGEAKVSCILCHRGIQLTLAYSWARPAIVAAGTGRAGMFLFFCFFNLIHFPLSPLSLSFISSTISSISLCSFSGI